MDNSIDAMPLIKKSNSSSKFTKKGDENSGPILETLSIGSKSHSIGASLTSSIPNSSSVLSAELKKNKVG